MITPQQIKALANQETKAAVLRKTASFPVSHPLETYQIFSLPAIMHLHPLTPLSHSSGSPPMVHRGAKPRQAPWVAHWRSLAVASTALVISSGAIPGLGVAMLAGLPPPAHAHANRCITIKATAATTVTISTLLASHLHCLRIEDNILLNDLDLDSLSKLTHLTIKNNIGLETIDLTEMNNLTHVHIDNNDNLKTIKFPKSPSLRYLSIINNHSLENLEEVPGDSAKGSFEIVTMTCLKIEHNNNLIEVNLPKLKHLTCLTINDNKCLGTIRLPALANFTRLHITNNEKLKEIELPELRNFRTLNIENNKSLVDINLPSENNSS